MAASIFIYRQSLKDRFIDLLYIKFKRKSSVNITLVLIHYEMFNVLILRTYISVAKSKAINK